MKLRKPSPAFLLVAAMLALLPCVAVLQYRWVGQVSRSERERMQANLQTGVTRFQQDFDHEITRILVHFQPDDVNGRDELLKRLDERLALWTTSAPYPQLLNGFFFAEPSQNLHGKSRRPLQRPTSRGLETAPTNHRTDSEHGSLRLLQLQRPGEPFQPTDWPPEMVKLSERLAKNLDGTFPKLHQIIQNLQQRLRVLPPGIEQKTGIVLGAMTHPIAEEIPALVIPVPRVQREPTGRQVIVNSLHGYVIVRLNLDFLTGELLPELTRRHFSTNQELGYHVTVADRAGRILYQSDPKSSAQTAAPDATGSILGVRFEDFRDFLRAELPRTTPQLKNGVGDIGIRQMRFQLFTNWRVDSPTGTTTDEPRGCWAVTFRHRAGSLQAVVAATQRRNLMLSFGVLLLLTASMVMLTLSAQRAQRLARRQIEFVAGVSHELRTPLAVISSAAENLADGVINEQDRIKQYGKLIKSESDRLADMVEQALEFAGAQSGRKKFNLRPVELGDLVDQALTTCRLQIEEGGFVVEKAIAPIEINADSGALGRAIQNLISNAIKYSGENRWIGIRAGLAENGAEAELTVEDRGLGIAPSELPHVFEPFYRAQVSVEAQIHGSGLGLSLVKHIIEAHGGRVSVTSALGQGSSFTLHLPIAPQPDGLHNEMVVREA